MDRPPLIFDGFSAGVRRYPVRLEGEGLSVAVLKKAEGDSNRILRLVETRGRSSRGRLILEPAAGTLVECDPVEWNDHGTPVEIAGPVDLELRPFEIRTYRWRVS